MSERTQRKRTAPLVVSAVALSLAIGALGRSGVAQAQAPAPAGGAQAAAVIDMTGTWVSVVTEDWRWRMVTPPKGDVSSVPVNAAARAVADAWDPAKDTADGNACKSYGAAGLSRVPGRINIAWQDANTLKMDFDAGTQTRLLRFGDVQPPAGADAGWQGFSAAVWEPVGGARGGGGGGGFGGGGGAAAAPAAAPAQGGRGAAAGAPAVPQFRGGDLLVTTTKMKPGYVRKNGIPYSATAVMTEYWDRHREPNGDEWLTVTTIVHDPTYFMQDFITSTHFKKEPNASKFAPKPCVAS